LNEEETERKNVLNSTAQDPSQQVSYTGENMQVREQLSANEVNSNLMNLEEPVANTVNAFFMIVYCHCVNTNNAKNKLCLLRKFERIYINLFQTKSSSFMVMNVHLVWPNFVCETYFILMYNFYHDFR